MARPNKYPRELRERAVRMVAEVRPDYPSEHAAITAVAGMLGIGSPETVRTWIRRQQVDVGQRPGVTTEGQVPGSGVTADPSLYALSAMKVSATTSLSVSGRTRMRERARTSSPR